MECCNTIGYSCDKRQMFHLLQLVMFSTRRTHGDVGGGSMFSTYTFAHALTHTYVYTVCKVTHTHTHSHWHLSVVVLKSEWPAKWSKPASWTFLFSLFSWLLIKGLLVCDAVTRVIEGDTKYYTYWNVMMVLGYIMNVLSDTLQRRFCTNVMTYCVTKRCYTYKWFGLTSRFFVKWYCGSGHDLCSAAGERRVGVVQRNSARVSLTGTADTCC